MERLLSCLDLGTIASEDLSRRTYAARADTLLDDYRKRRSCSGGGNSIDPCQLWHAAKSSLSARASHLGSCKLSSCRVCPSGNSGDFQHVLVLISCRSDPFREFRRVGSPRLVKIDGSIYPKSISFYCNNGDPAATPAYKLRRNARQFRATVGIEAKWPPHFEADVILVGDGRTLRTFNVSVLRPKTINVNLAGVHTLRLECFSSGISASEGWALAVAWGNARVTEGH